MNSKDKSCNRRSFILNRHLPVFIVLILTALSLAATGKDVPSAPVPMPEGKSILVQATLNDGKDDTSGVLRAIRQCRETGANRIVFSKGRYDFFAGANPNNPVVAMPFNAMKNLEIDGQGAKLIFHGVTSCMQFSNCEGVTVKNVAIDWDRPPFSVGKVLTSEPKFFDVEVFDEFPVKGGEPVGAFMNFDPKTKLQCRPAVDAYNSVTSTSLVRPQVLRVFLNREIRMKPGVLVVLRHEVYGQPALSMSNCRNMQFENVTIYAVPGMGLVAGHTENVTLDKFRVMIKPRTRRLMSATADATHFAGCTGLIRVKDCFFEGMGDDALNIKSGLYLWVLNRVDERTLLGEHSMKMASPPDLGDTMEFCHTDTMVPYTTRIVKKVDLLHPDPANPQNTVHRIEFTEPLPNDMKTSDVVGDSSRIAKLHFSGSRVHANRPRGILVQTRGALIENNFFDSVMTAGILVITEVCSFNESISAQDVVIRNNLFKDTNQSNPAPGAITVLCFRHDWSRPPLPGVFKKIEITNNTIDSTAESGIFVSNTDNLVIRNNRITKACQNPGGAIGSAAIALEACRNVVISGNTIDPKQQGTGFKSALDLGKGCEKKTIEVHGNIGF